MIDGKMLAIAKNNKSELAFVTKDMQEIFKVLSDENFDVETTEKGGPLEKEERFMSNTVLSSFYLHAYSLATLAFNAMMEDKRENPDTTKTILDYFSIEAANKLAIYKGEGLSDNNNQARC